MRLAVLQLRGDLEDPLPDRVARVADLVRAQAGADLVVLPELWPQGAFAYRTWAEQAEPLGGPTVAALAAAARDIGAYVHMGSILERAGDRLHNTSVVLGPDGQVQATYRKIHLFGFSAGEPALLTAGVAPVVWDSPWGGVGLATCYDLRFPELFRALLDGGAQTVLVVAGWPARRIAHWSLLARARAVEDQVLLVACNTVGRQGRTELGGRSVVVDPWGEVLAEAGDAPEELRLDVDPAAVAQVRADFPVLADRRLGVPQVSVGTNASVLT
jgi:predicted amidohydrolase